MLVCAVTHVFAVDGHRRGRRFGRGRMPLIVGTTDEGAKREGDQAGENKVFNHISLLVFVLLQRMLNARAAGKRRGVTGSDLLC